ncbi:MAG: DUF4251 domain-containing protein [Bacteroidetes bacterium]|nr:DUF4251 domain-containing protein [Bacteroidota bacterium]MBU1578410.1 DUF4251 domain-containing protein [Bacteroidota bacterium]MBU2466401.1 DUF4251 domain-containing protein [Bacteroidota bacterium]MBU2556678.1 DUF4251 domain-containing protein [Bacteroidota bacterium]MDA3943023.1 DUF4251 domain-containing protein [Bacteroidota bacterium]
MKSILLSLIFAIVVALPLSVFSQETSETLSRRELRKLEKKEKRLQEANKSAEARSKLLSMINDSSFILEATLVSNSIVGQSTPVSSRTNYVAVAGEEVVIQFAFEGSLGVNGLGGITNTGTLVSYSVDAENPRKPIFINGKIRPNPGTVLIPFNISVQDNGAAQFSFSNPRGDRFTLSGFLKSLQETKVFQGTPVFR